MDTHTLAVVAERLNPSNPTANSLYQEWSTDGQQWQIILCLRGSSYVLVGGAGAVTSPIVPLNVVFKGEDGTGKTLGAFTPATIVGLADIGTLNIDSDLQFYTFE